MIRTTTDTMRTLLFQASLPAHFWAESLHTSTYLLNRLPSVACLAPTPHHALFGTPGPLITITFVSSDVRVTLTPLPLLPTSWLPVRLNVSSSGTPRITRGTVALTWLFSRMWRPNFHVQFLYGFRFYFERLFNYYY